MYIVLIVTHNQAQIADPGRLAGVVVFFRPLFGEIKVIRRGNIVVIVNKAKGKTVSIDDNLNRFRVCAFFNSLRGVHSHCQRQRTHQ